MKKALFISDNYEMLLRFRELEKELAIATSCGFVFYYAYSHTNTSLRNVFKGQDWITGISVKTEIDRIINSYDIVFSLHCKQFFPKKLVESVRCINVHPGLNPYNRGWFPQVFSILNKMPLGATIHEIDEKLDHGPILVQKEVAVYPWDTSLTAYNRVLEAEIDLLRNHLCDILNDTIAAKPMPHEGNVNLKADFDALCEVDLEKVQSIGDTIDLLRALTHGNYKNAYFMDKKTGTKVYVNINMSV